MAERIKLAGQVGRAIDNVITAIPTYEDGHPVSGWYDLDALLRLAATEARRVAIYEGEPRVPAPQWPEADHAS